MFDYTRDSFGTIQPRIQIDHPLYFVLAEHRQIQQIAIGCVRYCHICGVLPINIK